MASNLHYETWIEDANGEEHMVEVKGSYSPYEPATYWQPAVESEVGWEAYIGNMLVHVRDEGYNVDQGILDDATVEDIDIAIHDQGTEDDGYADDEYDRLRDERD